MRRITCVLLGLSLALPALAQISHEQDTKAETKVKAQEQAKTNDLTDPKEIFKRADDATKKVKLISYKASNSARGEIASMVPRLKGSAIMSGEDESGFDKYRIEFKGELPDGRKVEGTIGGNGDEFFLLDPSTKTAYVDIDPSVQGERGEMARQFLAFREFSHPDPFGDEINGDKRELKGSKTIEGEDCYHLYVTYSGGRGEAEWYISKKDFLPRQVDRIQGERGAFSVTISGLELTQKADPDAFKAKLPDGWTKTDEPAP